MKFIYLGGYDSPKAEFTVGNIYDIVNILSNGILISDDRYGITDDEPFFMFNYELVEYFEKVK